MHKCSEIHELQEVQVPEMELELPWGWKASRKRDSRIEV